MVGSFSWMRGRSRALRALRALLVPLLIAAAGCDRAPSSAPPPTAAASAPAGVASGPAVAVTTTAARQRDFPITLDATGTVSAVTTVEVRPQVSSVITQVLVKEGQFVRAGQPLFVLDARSDEANVAKLAAQTAKDEAALKDAQRQLDRNRDLLAQNFISPSVVDTSQAQVDAQRAVVASDRAAVRAGQVALGYARIVAPAAGRAGAVPLAVGSAVQANTTTMVTLTQLDPIDVAFSVPQRHLADMLDGLRSGGAPVAATVPDSAASAPVLQGRLSFVDNAVDAGSGTVKVKARFDNGSSRLWPGAFVRVALTVRTLAGAVVVPQAAIVQGQRGSLVFVVEDGKAVARPVQVQATQGEDAAVTGVRAGERVVLDGRQNLRPGVAVSERERERGRGASSPGGGASAASANANPNGNAKAVTP
jgi:RND family efflux transporter MFP subunit